MPCDQENDTMPIFEYRCKKCGHVTEVLERPGGGSRHECEKCGSAQMEKLLSAFGVGRGSSSSSGSCPTGTCPLS
jgi:putative FmdB family regulatory protein